MKEYKMPTIGNKVVIRHSSDGNGKLEHCKQSHFLERVVSAVYDGSDDGVYTIRDNAGESWSVIYAGNDCWQTVIPRKAKNVVESGSVAIN